MQLAPHIKYPITYRPDIDGLRALAILAVIIFHFSAKLLPSGYVGVDIFFVISGFLITRIILKEYSQNHFSFAQFYLRRIRRIFPALFTMLFCSFILGALTLTSGDMLWFSKGFHYASLQISNLFFQRSVDYFNEGRNFEPLLHTWSLGVEEQFYLLMPVFVVGIFHFRKSKKLAFYGVVILSLISLAASEYLVSAHQKIAFYSLLSRFWELGIGCLLAFIGPNKFSTIGNNILAIIGTVLLALSLILINQEKFPGILALLPCLGAALVIFTGSRKTVVTSLISNPVFVFIGKISYSLYLWHLPLLVFYKEYSGEKTLDSASLITLLLVIFIISYCSWRFIETPFRQRYVFAKNGFYFNLLKHPFCVAALCIFAFVSLATISKKTRGLDFRLEKSELLNSTAIDQYATFINGKDCGLIKPDVAFPDMEKCVIGNNPNYKVAIFGDSHAGHYSSSVIDWAQRRELSAASFYYFSCPPFLTNDHTLKKDQRCWEYRDQVLQILQQSPHIKYVFLGSSWSDQDAASYANFALFKENFAKTVAVITAMNKNLIILGRIPDFNVDESGLSPLKCIEKKLVPLQKIIPVATPNCTELPLKAFSKQLEIAAFMKSEVSKYKNASYFDPFPYFCDAEKCSAVKNGKLLYADKGHINKSGSDYISAADFKNLTPLTK